MGIGQSRRATLSALTITLAAWLSRAGAASAGTPEEAPERFVEVLVARVVAALRDQSVGEAQRLDRVDALTAGAFDLARTARIALGRHWKTAPEPERREFAALFRAYVLTSYGRRFRQYADRTFRVTGVEPTGEDVVVASLVEGGTTPIRLHWRLARNGEGWRVLDVLVEGVSLLVTFRNEFAAVIERHGGRVAGLLDELRQRVAAERAQLAG
jgi:phospholipid transport system substrate-binding protein